MGSVHFVDLSSFKSQLGSSILWTLSKKIYPSWVRSHCGFLKFFTLVRFVHIVDFVKFFTLVGSVHFHGLLKFFTLVGSVHIVDFVKFFTLVGSVHFHGLGPSTLWTYLVIYPCRVRPFCGLRLVTNPRRVRPLCGLCLVINPCKVRPLCGLSS